MIRMKVSETVASDGHTYHLTQNFCKSKDRKMTAFTEAVWYGAPLVPSSSSSSSSPGPDITEPLLASEMTILNKAV